MTAFELAGLAAAVMFTASATVLVAVIVSAIAHEFARARRPRPAATEPHLRLVGAEVIDARARFAERRQIGGAA